jgi:hypothetical protein
MCSSKATRSEVAGVSLRPPLTKRAMRSAGSRSRGFAAASYRSSNFRMPPLFPGFPLASSSRRVAATDCLNAVPTATRSADGYVWRSQDSRHSRHPTCAANGLMQTRDTRSKSASFSSKSSSRLSGSRHVCSRQRSARTRCSASTRSASLYTSANSNRSTSARSALLRPLVRNTPSCTSDSAGNPVSHECGAEL